MKTEVLVLFLFGFLVPGLCHKYLVIIMTGRAGTSSQVELRLVGNKGETSGHLLKPRGGIFKPNSKNIFFVEDNKDVGRIDAAEVYLKGGSPWYIEKIIVNNGGLYILSFKNYIYSGKWTTVGTKCSDGFKKGPSGTCIDIDECANNNPCKSPLATCQNTIGSHVCSCPLGYRSTFDGDCEDIDECSYSTVKMCEQLCVNTPGSYQCKCRNGYEMKNRKCVLKPVITYCSRCIPVDNITTYSPPRCLLDNSNKEGDICTRGCVHGYEIRSKDLKTVTCTADGTWRGWFSSNYCIGRRCSVLPKVVGSYVIPHACGTLGGQYKGKPCEQYCYGDYEKVKGTPLVCQADGTYTGTPIGCKRIWPKPWISCPVYIYVTLAVGRNTSSVGNEWKLPRSNYKNFTHSPAYANEQYQFPAGSNKIKWTVTNPDGETASCFQDINIQDKEPPKVVYCPGPIVYVTAYKGPPYYVNYKEPVFSDNVGVATVTKTYVKKKYDQQGSYNQYFDARDKAGNKARCKFVVTIGGSKCTKYPDNRGLSANFTYVTSSATRRMVVRYCPAGSYDSNGLNLYNCTKETGKWFPDRVGNCVVYTMVNESTPCPSGNKRIAYPGYKRNHTFCLPCASGEYLKDNKCTMCSAGTYQHKTGELSCNKCPSGTYSLKGANKCRDLCPVGTFSKDGMKPWCHLCPEGQYQDQPGQTGCKVCSGNKFPNTKLGATSCQDAKPSNQSDNGLLQISSIVKPKKWNWKGGVETVECHIKDNNYSPVAVYWKIINKLNVPVDFLGKMKFQEIKNDADKVVGARMIVTDPHPSNEYLEYVCVAENFNGATERSVKIPWPVL